MYSTEVRIVSAAAARNTSVKKTAKPSSRKVSPNAPSARPRMYTAIHPAIARPARLVQTSTPFSLPEVNRSSSSTTMAATTTSAPGRSGSRLSATPDLHRRGLGPNHRHRQCLGLHTRERRARRPLHPRQERLRIHAHEDDQRDERRHHSD